FTTVGSAGDKVELTNGTTYAPDDANPAPFPNPLHTATPVVGAAWTTTAAMITQVRTDMGIAFTFLKADPNPGAPTQVMPTQLGGQTLTRGVYKTASNVLLTTGPLHLDAQGDPNSVFIFVIGGTLTIGAPSGAIILDNQAQAKNVYFVTSGLTIIEAGQIVHGNIFATSQVNVLAGANITGRLWAQSDQVTLIGDTVTKAP
ncbi:MAG: ice-binding family protein, partial [Dehalococcoidia bacterium]|nr:ice-binding family protein [Dehalococcoidia bacterium]